jgi:hypothetical protein
VIHAAAYRWKRRHRTESGVEKRAVVLEVRSAWTTQDCRWDLTCPKESRQRLQASSKCTNSIDPRLNGQLCCACTQIAHFDGSVVQDFPLHAKGPGQYLRLNLIQDDALGRCSSFFLSGWRNIYLQQASTSEEACSPTARKVAAHQAGVPGRVQVMSGFCSVCSCGGSCSKGKLCGVTS